MAGGGIGYGLIGEASAVTLPMAGGGIGYGLIGEARAATLAMAGGGIGYGLIGEARAATLAMAGGGIGYGLIGEASAVAAGIGGNGLIGVARAWPAAKAAKAAPHTRQRSFKDVESMRFGSLWTRIGHCTGRIAPIVYAVYHESNHSYDFWCAPVPLGPIPASSGHDWRHSCCAAAEHRIEAWAAVSSGLVAGCGDLRCGSILRISASTATAVCAAIETRTILPRPRTWSYARGGSGSLLPQSAGRARAGKKDGSQVHKTRSGMQLGGVFPPAPCLAHLNCERRSVARQNGRKLLTLQYLYC